MATRSVGPNSTFPSIAAAMLASGPNDTIVLEQGYVNETATIMHSGMTVSGTGSSTGIVLQLGTGISTFTLVGAAPIRILDATDGNGIVGNAGANRITVTAGADAVDGGLGIDRLTVDYRLATGAVTGDSTSNFTEAGGGGRLVTITDGTVEHFTIYTGAGADTITTGNGHDVIRTGAGAGTVSAGQGANNIVGGGGADTITALDGGNYVDAGNGTNSVTTGAGIDQIFCGTGADTIIAGGGTDTITVRGGADTVGAGAGHDRLIVNYSAMTTDVIGGVTGGNPLSGHTGHIEDAAVATLDFVGVEVFTITTGSGNDSIVTGGGNDTLVGGAGNDRLTGGQGNDSLNGGSGSDTASYAAAAAATAGVRVNLANAAAQNTVGAGTDTLISIERLTGSAFNDTLTGNGGANILNGGAGNDVLNGGAGNDTLIGGTGNDYFLFNSALGAANVDTLSGYTVADDTIRLENAVFTSLASPGALSGANFRSGAGLTAAVDGNDFLVYNTTTGHLFYDANGSAGPAAVHFATLTGVVGTLGAGDFAVV